jgi:hypothetical protein
MVRHTKRSFEKFAITLLLLFLWGLTNSLSAQSESYPAIKKNKTLYVKLYNNVYSQESTYNSNGKKISDSVRRSFVTNILEVSFMNNKRIWFGFDAYYRASRQDPKGASPLKVLSYENNGLNAQASFSHLGPKLMWKPISGNDKLTTKVLLLFPLAKSVQQISAGIPSLDNSGTQFWIQMAYNAKLAEHLYGYLEVSAVSRWGRNGDPSSDFYTPLKAFISYFPVGSMGLFTFSDLTPTISNPTSYYFQAGGGVKIFPTKDFEIELSVSRFLAGKSAGAGHTINLGLAYSHAY